MIFKYKKHQFHNPTQHNNLLETPTTHIQKQQVGRVYSDHQTMLATVPTPLVQQTTTYLFPWLLFWPIEHLFLHVLLFCHLVLLWLICYLG
jgi:hypothetical protein|tara:strand:- start:1565 stop:1837 length:273 start_codon:yes stop_codon:yes gene_type:complete